MLLGAAATCRRHPPDATTLTVVGSAFEPVLQNEPLQLEVRAGALCAGSVCVEDPDRSDGLCARLSAAGYAGLDLDATLGDEDLLRLLTWMSQPPDALNPLSFQGLRLVSIPVPRSPDELLETMYSLSRDPETGIDLVATHYDASGPSEAKRRLVEAAEALRARVGRARVAQAESQLRRACTPDIVQEAAERLRGSADEAVVVPASGEAPPLSLDELIVIEDPT